MWENYKSHMKVIEKSNNTEIQKPQKPKKEFLARAMFKITLEKVSFLFFESSFVSSLSIGYLIL